MGSPTLFAATWSDGVFVGTGAIWHHELAGQSVSGLAPDGAGGALAIVGGRTLRRRTAEGAWSTLATAEHNLSSSVGCGGDIFVGTDDARVLRMSQDAGFEELLGFKCVAGRDRWYAGTAIVDGRLVGPPLGIRSMTATCDAAVLLANVHVGGIPRSTDHGVTWNPTIEIDADVHQVCAHPSRANIVIAAAAVGLCVSEDGGASWSIEQDGLHALHCSTVAFAGDDIFVSTSEGPFAARGAVYRRPVDGSQPLRPVGGGLPDWMEGGVDTRCIASLAFAIAVVDGAGSVYVSEDAGCTWSRASQRVPASSGLLVLGS